MKRIIALTAAIVLAWGTAWAGALPGGVRLGQDIGATQTQLRNAGCRVARLTSDAPQALRKSLIDSGLLQAMNFFGVRRNPFLENASSGSRMEFLLAKKRGVSYAVGFVNGKSRAVFINAKAGVSSRSNPHDPSRLTYIRSILGEFKASCSARPVKKDRYGNAFQYKGFCGGGTFGAIYDPGKAEVRALIYR